MRLLFLSVLLLLLAREVYPQEVAKGKLLTEIKPPFGLQWGHAAEAVEKLLPGAKATLVARRTTPDGRTAWDVEGLVQTGLRRTVFYFSNARLDEVELQYEKADWDEAKYLRLFTEVRERIDKRYGSGRDVSPSDPPDAVNAVQWTLGGNEIDLRHHLTKEEGHERPWISVHYKTHLLPAG